MGGGVNIYEDNLIIIRPSVFLVGSSPAIGWDPINGTGTAPKNYGAFSNSEPFTLMYLYDRQRTITNIIKYFGLDVAKNKVYFVRLDNKKGFLADDAIVGGSYDYVCYINREFFTTDDVGKEIHIYVNDTPPPFEWEDISL